MSSIQRVSRLTSYLISGALVLALFQNCAPQVAFGPPSDGLSGLNESASTQDPRGGTEDLSSPGASVGTEDGAPSGSNPNAEPSASPFLALRAATPSQPEGQTGRFSLIASNVTQLKYKCVNRVTEQVLAQGSLSDQQTSISVPVFDDLRCNVSGVSTVSSSTPNLEVAATMDVTCEGRVKDPATGRCRDFVCKRVVQLDASQLMNIPARTAEGLCYALKLMSAIPVSPSEGKVDASVVSRNHGLNATGNRNPFVMGEFYGQFKLLGARNVKLSGGLSATAPILVDNYVLFGVFPSSTSAENLQANLSSYYMVNGTSDSSVVNGQNTPLGDYILFNNRQLKIKAFATEGTSSVAPVDITSRAQPGVAHILDIRALDCGGSRNLSDIYLLFQ